MRKKNLLMVVACTVLATANAPTAAAQENCLADKPQPSAPGEPDGVIGDHEYVDLGLLSGTLWATYNVGATSPYETGDFFAWGEVDPKENFTWENYKFFVGYEYDPNNGSWAILRDIGSNICGTEYDAARYQWGNGWRLPNEAERYELRMFCWQKYITEKWSLGCPYLRAQWTQHIPSRLWNRALVWTGGSVQQHRYFVLDRRRRTG